MYNESQHFIATMISKTEEFKFSGSTSSKILFVSRKKSQKIQTSHQCPTQNLKKTVPDKAAKIFKDVRCKFRFDVNVLQNHEKNVDERKKTLRDLKRIIKERADENAALTKELEELNVSVNERRHIHEVNGKITTSLVTLHSFHGP